jgi:hypothetical protein
LGTLISSNFLSTAGSLIPHQLRDTQYAGAAAMLLHNKRIVHNGKIENVTPDRLFQFLWYLFFQAQLDKRDQHKQHISISERD